VKWQSVGVCIEIRDDGVGFDVDRMKGPSDKPAGFGLFSIRERMKGLGGSLEISSSPGGGSSFILTVPISAEAPSAGEGA
jgi:signal transduction histidine kinase